MQAVAINYRSSNESILGVMGVLRRLQVYWLLVHEPPQGRD